MRDVFVVPGACTLVRADLFVALGGYDAGIDYLSVTGRTKSVASFSAKANRTEGDGPLYPDPLDQITDQIGVRVITYVHSDVAAVAGYVLGELTPAQATRLTRLAAAGTIVALPIVVLYFLLQRRFISGMLSGISSR